MSARLPALRDGSASRRPTEPDDVLVSNVSELAPFLEWPLALYCPADTQRVAPDSWAVADTLDTSYLISQDVSTDDTNRVFATCQVHGHQILSDGRQLRPGLDAIRPELGQPVLQADGRVSLTVHGIAGLGCVVEATTDLQAWMVLAQGRFSEDECRFTDLVAPEPATCFYRARYR